MLNMILKPEISNNIIRKYHFSNKIMIPLIIPSLILYNFDYNENISQFFKSANILNLGFHSYVSTSCVIGDYIKNKNISLMFRCINVKSHTIAIAGFIYYIFK